MKKLLLAAVVGLISLLSNSAQAQTNITGNFNVNIALTSVCTLVAPTDINFTYTSFQAGPGTVTGGDFSVTCTNLAAYTMALSGAAVTDDAVNLAYTLTLPTGPFAGTGGVQNYNIAGAMAGGQGGTCATSTCTNAAATNRAKVLTITY